ncbi:MAG: xylulokinase [Candidatus Latescibacteria bacterium]|nr:xylulokinase [Candidatus Latescibacterota bacterium]
MRYLIGIDIGTSGTKSVLIDEAGTVRAVAQEETGISTPQPGWAEQDPEAWWRATCRTLKKVLSASGVDPRTIAGVGLSGQMHGIVLLDKDRRVLRPAIIWADGRSAEQCRSIYERVGWDQLARWTANPVAPGFMAASLLWMSEHEPDVFERTAAVLLPKDYVRWRLTGEMASDVSDAAGTLLFDVAHRRWSGELLKALDLPADLFPKVLESSQIAGTVGRMASGKTGLTVGTPVVAGAGDQAAAAVGNGIIAPGTMLSTIGTGGQLFAPLSGPVYDPQLRTHTFCHALGDRWFMMGAILSAGLSLRWFRDRIAGKSYEELSGMAAQIPPGSEGLIFLPYLIGERTPHMDPNARGVFFGLGLHHTLGHLVRAIMEGVTFALRDALLIFRELGVLADRIVISGGGARSPIWRQIQADVFRTKVVRVHGEERAGIGAAMLAGIGTGVYEDFEDACRKAVRYEACTVPIAANAARYDRLYDVFHGLYPKLKDDFVRLEV